MNTTHIIKTHQLSRRFGKFLAVDQVSLEVPSHSIYGFLGPNGAGKTTTIRMLLGLIQATEGEIYLFGQDLSKHRSGIMSRIGALVESPTIYAHLSGYENLCITQQLLGLSKQRIDECLDIVDLSNAARQRAGSYSQGMKQRLGLARALLSQPDLLILDEPTNGLDPAGIRDMRELIRTLPERIGTTIFLSSHLLSEIQQVATHIGIIQAGRLIFQDSLAALQSQQGRQLRLRVSDSVRTQQILRQAGYEVQLTPDDELLILGQIQLNAITEQLAACEIDVISLQYGVQSLELLFMQITEKPTETGTV